MSDKDDCISRQAAIDALARMMPRSYTPDGSHPADEEIYKIQEIYVDCIESIEILPAVQPEPCEDAISRQAAIELCDWYDNPSLHDDLEKLPSVQPERKKGHWFIDSDGYYPYCSECRTEPSSGHMTDFCPNCGADMRKDEEHDE